MNPEVTLHLKGCCIETAAKNEFNRLMDAFFSSAEEDDNLLKLIELLKQFLEESDFPGLRTSDNLLSGEVESTVVLSRDDDGTILISSKKSNVD